VNAHKGIWTALKVLAVLLVPVLLWLVLSHIGFGRVIEAMRRASARAILIAALLYLAVFVLWTLRWQLLMKRKERKSIAALLPIYMAGIFGNMVTPGARVGGEPVRAFYMSRAFGGEKSAHLGVVLVDKLGNGAVFMLFLVASVIFIALSIPLGTAVKAGLAGGALLATAVTVGGLLATDKAKLRSHLVGRILPAIYGSALLRFVRRTFPTYDHFESYVTRKLRNVFGPMAHAAGSPKALAKILLISAVSWLLFYLAHYVLFAELGARIDFVKAAVIVTVASFLGDASFTPGGAGFTEAAMIGLCAAYGVDADAAAAVTLISRGLFYAYGLGLGALCLGALAALYGRRAQE